MKYFIKIAMHIGIILSLSTLLLSSCNKTSPDEDPDEVKICEFDLYPPLDTIIQSHTAWTQSHYPERIAFFMEDTISANSIIMLGNSLTEKAGNWNVKLNTVDVFNRGISGDNTDGVFARLGEIICAEPKCIFIMIGTNDLWTISSAQTISNKIDSIGKTLTKELPNSKIFVQTIMPMGENSDVKNKLMQINTNLLSVDNAEYILINTFDAMANDNGDLSNNLTDDGVHLNTEGYNKWSDFLKHIMIEYEI